MVVHRLEQFRRVIGVGEQGTVFGVDKAVGLGVFYEGDEGVVRFGV